jgi:hypothetical protein
MQRLIKPIILIVGIGFSLTIFGCPPPIVIKEEHPVYAPAPHEPGPPPWAPAHGHRAKHHYYYYPASYVYLDVERKLYFYLYTGQWQVSVSLPADIHINVSDYVILDMDTDKPYNFHSDVVKRYPPGQLKKLDKGKGKGKEKRKWD